MTGGAGNDQLSGDGGDDIYIYALGDGNDVIIDGDGNDIIRFATGVDPMDIIVSKSGSGNDLILEMIDGSTITLHQAILNDSNHIEGIEFSNGTVWSHEDLIQRANFYLGWGFGF